MYIKHMNLILGKFFKPALLENVSRNCKTGYVGVEPTRGAKWVGSIII